MFEDFFLTNLDIRPRQSLPEYIRVGFFHLSPKENIPALFPIHPDTFNCMTLLYSAKDRNDAKAQLQYIALDILKQVDPSLLKISLVDIGVNTSFPYLCPLDLPHIKFLTTKDQLRNEIEELYQYARYISTQCLQFKYSTLASYNRDTRDKEAYHFLFIPDRISAFFKDHELEMLHSLMREGGKCGIYVFTVEEENEWSPMADGLIIINYIHNTIECSNDQLYGIAREVEQLKRFCSKYSLTPEHYCVTDIESVISMLKHKEKIQETEEDFLSIPIGKSGRSIKYLSMGKKSGIYHGFIAGQSGTGKTNLLNNIITTIAKEYSPDELRLYLLDYKQGVEFKIYENHPNVELLMLDNTNLQAGIDVLRELVDKMRERANIFAELGDTINDIDQYNRVSSQKMPRILVVIDEVQQLFKTYEIRRLVNPLVQDLAKQGRAFGIHMLFSSQSYTDCHIESDILSQMPLRIAFTLSSPAECRAILGADNNAPIKLPKYSAIYNERNGEKEANVQIKTILFETSQIADILEKARSAFHPTPFEKRILTNISTKSNDSHSTASEGATAPIIATKSRKEYEEEDFSTEFGF